jgi:hypothetical protein
MTSQLQIRRCCPGGRSRNPRAARPVFDFSGAGHVAGAGCRAPEKSSWAGRANLAIA